MKFVGAEFRAHSDEAKQRFGEQARLRRSSANSAAPASALLAMFGRATSTTADARFPEPLVNIAMTQEAFETELARLARGEPTVDAPSMPH